MMSLSTGRIREVVFQSEVLNEELTILIYVPAYYSPMNKYPLLIVNDGKDYFQLGRLPRYMDALIDENEIEAAIVVGIPYNNVKDRRSKYHPAGSKHEVYKQFLVNELLPWVEDEYSTITLASGRTIVGDSLAATISLLTAIEYPHTFGQVILHSPYVNDEVLAQLQNSATLPHLNVYHVVGEEEDVVLVSDIKDFLTPNRTLHQIFQQKGFSTFYDEFKGGHSWKFWQPDLKRALLYMLS